MNSDKHSSLRQRGNAMIYILLSLALIGLLTVVISRQNDQANSSIDSEQAQLMAGQITTYANTVQTAIDGMIMSGTAASALDFTRPTDAGFDGASNINKVYHPDGGGLNNGPFSGTLFTGTSTAPPPGWYIGRFNNVVWTPTTANDVMISAIGINAATCAQLNKNIKGTTTIPVLAGTGNPATYFVSSVISGVGNASLDNSVCLSCEGFSSLCVANTGSTLYTYYSIISGQ